LSGFGVTLWRTFATPLWMLSVTEVIALLYNWILREIERDEVVTFLIVDDKTNHAYQLSLASRKGRLVVERVIKRPDLKDKLLYYWTADTTFANLTREKIEQSLRAIVKSSPETATATVRRKNDDCNQAKIRRKSGDTFGCCQSGKSRSLITCNIIVCYCCVINRCCER